MKNSNQFLDRYPDRANYDGVTFMFGLTEDIARGTKTADAGNTFVIEAGSPMRAKFTTSANDNERVLWVENDCRVLLSKGALYQWDTAFALDDVTQTEFIVGAIASGDTTPFIDTGYVSDNLTLEKIDGSARLYVKYGRNNASRAGYGSIDTGLDLVAAYWYQFRVELQMSTTTDGSGQLTVKYRKSSTQAGLMSQSWIDLVTGSTGALTGLNYDEPMSHCIGYGNGEAAANTGYAGWIRAQFPSGFGSLTNVG